MRLLHLLSTLALGGLALAGSVEDLQQRGVAQGKNGWLFHVAEFGQYKQETPQDIDEKLRFMGTINRLFESRGIKLVVALVPAKLHLYSDQLPDDLPLTDPIRTRYTRAIAQLREMNVRAVDLYTPMAAGRRAPEEAQYPVYQKQDHHWSSRGAVIAAKAVGDYVKANLDLKDIPAVNFDLVAQKPETYLESSLTPRLPQNRQAAYKPEPFVPYELKRLSPSGGLLDQTDPLVTLVGSSASKGGRLWPFDLGLNAFLGREVANAAQAGRGPWLPMEDYLRDIAFQRTPPKVVIWQLWEAFLLDVDQADLPQEWALTLAPLILDGCASPRPLTSDGKALTLPKLSLGDYLVADVTPKGTERLGVQLSGAGMSRELSLKLGPEGTAYRIKVPLYLDRPGTPQQLAFSSKGGSFRLERARLCSLPAEVVSTLTPTPGTLDLVATNPARVALQGFSDLENGSIRWAEGASTSVSVWSAGEKTGRVQFTFYNPIAGQELVVLWNGKPLETLSGLPAGQDLQRALELRFEPGRNTLEFRVKHFNGSGSDFAKGDSRPLSILFRSLQWNQP